MKTKERKEEKTMAERTKAAYDGNPESPVDGEKEPQAEPWRLLR